MQRSSLIIAAALLFAGPLAAQVTFNLTSAGSGESLAGVYTSPYAGNINGGPTIPVICDDFADESYIPESWHAYVTPLSSLTSGTPDSTLKWPEPSGSGIAVDGLTGVSLNQAQAYTVASVLAVEILQNTAPSQSTNEEELSYAMWALFDPTGSQSDPGAIAWLQQYDSGAYAGYIGQVVTDLDNAVKYVFDTTDPSHLALNSANTAQVAADVNATTIYTYDAALGAPTGACGSNCPSPQEFITVNMAEPSSPALIAFDLIGIGAVLLFIRRRQRERRT